MSLLALGSVFKNQDNNQTNRQKPQQSVNASTQQLLQEEARQKKLGKQLQKLLNPTSDRLLHGFSDLIRQVKASTVAAQEDRREQEQKYFEARVARFDKDRRSGISKDAVIRDFLMQKKADMYEIIEENMKQLRVFDRTSLISNMSPEDKIDLIRENLRAPNLTDLAGQMNAKNTSGLLSSELSPASRCRIVREQKKEKEKSKRLVTVHATDDSGEFDLGAIKSQERKNLMQQAKDVTLVDLGQLLEDIEVIELETLIKEDEHIPPGEDKEADEEIEKNRAMLKRIKQRPTLGELLRRTIDQKDVNAALKAEERFTLMKKHSKRNTAGRIFQMVGLTPVNQSQPELQNNLNFASSMDVSFQQANSQQQMLASKISDAQFLRGAEMVTPSQRALQTFNQIVQDKMSSITSHKQASSKYIPYVNLMHRDSSELKVNHFNKENPNDSYKYDNIESILSQVASQRSKFQKDIDNSEEENLSDDELRLKIKERKAKQRIKRDDLVMVEIAAVGTAGTVEGIRQQIEVGSVLDKGINLAAFQERQARIRAKMQLDGQPSPPPEIDSAEQSLHQPSIDKIQRQEDLGHSYSFKQLAQQPSQKNGVSIYEPLLEEENEDQSDNEYEEQKSQMRDMREIEVLERLMLKYQALDEQQVADLTADKNSMEKFQFKASFISHLCAIKEKSAEYKVRLKAFNRQLSTAADLNLPASFEKQMIQEKIQMSKNRSQQTSLEPTVQDAVRESQAQSLKAESVHKRSHSSLDTRSLNLSMMKQPTMNENFEASPPQEPSKFQASQSRNLFMPSPPSKIKITKQAQSQPQFQQPTVVGSQTQSRLLQKIKKQGVELANHTSTDSPNNLKGLQIAPLQKMQLYQKSDYFPQKPDARFLNNASNMQANQHASDQFSKMSLSIVLNTKGMDKSKQQRVFINKALEKEQQSTMTVLDPGTTADGLALQGNQVRNSQARLQSNNSVSSKYKLNSNNGNSTTKFAQYETLKIKAHNIPQPKELDNEFTTLYQGSPQRGLLHKNNMSASQKMLLEHKPRGTQDGIINTLATAPRTIEEQNQTDFENTPDRDHNQRSQPGVLSQNLSQPSLAEISLKVTENDGSSPRAKANTPLSRMHILEEHRLLTQTSDETAPLYGAQPYVSLGDANADLPPDSVGSPHFPAESMLRRLSVARTQMEYTLARQQVEEKHKPALPITTFAFPLPARLDGQDEEAPEEVVQSFRAQLMQRFGGAGGPDASFYDSASKDADSMSKTQWLEPRGPRGALMQNRNPSLSPIRKGKKGNRKHGATQRSFLAQEVSLGSKQGLEALVARANLGPTEYLSLSSGLRTPTDDRGMKRVSLTDANSTTQTLPLMKNVVKLELNDRPQQLNKQKRDPIADLKQVSHVGTGTNEDSSAWAGQDTEELLRPMMVHQHSFQIAHLGQRAIREENGERQVPSPLRIGAIKVNKKSLDSGIVQTEFASNLNLFGQGEPSISPARLPKLSPQGTLLADSQRKPPTKGFSTMAATPGLGEKTPFKTANMRKLSVSILGAGSESGKNSSKLRLSPTGRNLPAATGAYAGVQVPDRSMPLGRSMITPHLQSTNLKIALQKERSRRFIHNLHQQQSSPPVTSTASIPEGPEGLALKAGSPFLQPRPIDLGLHIDQEFTPRTFRRSPAGAVDEFRHGQGSDLSHKRDVRGKSTLRLGQGGVIKKAGAAAQAAEYVVDDQGHFVEVLKRNASQLENPLLHCSEEDETVEGKSTAQMNPTVANSRTFVNGQLQEASRTSGERSKQSGGATQSAQGKRPINLDGTGQEVRHRDTKDDNARQNSRLQGARASDYGEPFSTKTPEGDQRLASLGGEDIVTDGASHIRIEQDIKDMQGLLPPLLETDSTKQFFKDDEIREHGEEQSQAKARIREESVPLQYVRDSSKLSGPSKQKSGKDNLSKSRWRKGGGKSPSPSQLLHNKELVTTGIQYTPTPLSILHEQPLLSEVGDAQFGSAASVAASKNGRTRNSQAGPYLKSFTQRIRLPNLNRTQYGALNQSFTVTRAPLEQHSPRDRPKRGSNARSSVATKHHNVFATHDGDTGVILEKSVANNFQVKIKNQLSQNRTQVMDGAQRFIDLHKSARNTEGFGMKVQSVERAPQGRTGKRDAASSNRLQSQILIYEGHDGANSKKFRNKNQKMHQTVLSRAPQMPPILTSPTSKRAAAGLSRSLLLKGKGCGAESRASPKGSDHSTQGHSPLRGSKLAPGDSLKVESGSMVLSPQRKVRLAAAINTGLVPVKLPGLDTTVVEEQPAKRRPVEMHDASTRVRMASIRPDDTSMAALQKQSLKSQGSSAKQVAEIGRMSAVEADIIEEGGRYDSANPGDQQQSPGLPGSQGSDETLALAKQASLVGVGADKSHKNTLLDSQTNFEPSSYLAEEPLPKVAREQELNKDSERGQSPDKTDNATSLSATPMLTRSQLMLEQHQMQMATYRLQQQQQAELIDKYYTKQPISYAGQTDISNSVWVDTEQYAAKKKPELMLKDLNGEQRINGKVEPGPSPFDKQDFLRMDGQTVKMAQTTRSKKSKQ